MSVFLEVETKKEKAIEGDFNVACFVLLTNNAGFNLPEGENSYALDLLGKPMYEFITRVCPTKPITIECSENDNPLEVVRPYLKDKDLTLVLYGDTPLLTRGNINNILNFVINRGLNVCKLTRGFVFKTDYIKRVDAIFAPQTYYFAEEEFKHPTNFGELAAISRVLERRIIDYHLSRGVRFIEANTCYVESDVSIAGGAIIGPMVSLCGQTQIADGAKIGANTKIVSSSVGHNSVIGSGVISNSVVQNNCIINENVVIASQSFVGDNSVIENGAIIENSSISQNVKIGLGATLKYAKIYRDAVVFEGAVVVGENEQPSRVLHGAKVGQNATILKGVAIKEETSVAPNSVIKKEDESKE